MLQVGHTFSLFHFTDWFIDALRIALLQWQTRALKSVGGSETVRVWVCVAWQLRWGTMLACAAARGLLQSPCFDLRAQFCVRVVGLLTSFFVFF